MSLEIESAASHPSTLSDSPLAMTLGPIKFHDDGLIQVGPQLFSYADSVEVTYKGHQVSRRQGSAVTTVTTPALAQHQFRYLVASNQWQQRAKHDYLRSLTRRSLRQYDEYRKNHGVGIATFMFIIYALFNLYILYFFGVIICALTGMIIAKLSHLEDLRTSVFLALGVPVIIPVYLVGVVAIAKISQRRGLVVSVVDEVLLACVKLAVIIPGPVISLAPLVRESLELAPATWWQVLQHLASSLGM